MSAPFVRGSATSLAAALSTNVNADEHRVFNLISAMLTGLTDDEVEVALNMRHQTASARRRGLVLKGLVKDSGLTRPTRSGRKATVWTVA